MLRALKRLRRLLENQHKWAQTDYHAFIKKWKSMGRAFTPAIFEVKLDFSRKVNVLRYEDLANVNFQHHHYTNRELCQAALQVFEHMKVAC